MAVRDTGALHDRLFQGLADFSELAVAFSGGVDSTLLLAVAREAIGDRVLAVTGDSPIHSRREVNAATETARRLGVPHRVIATGQMAIPEFLNNGPDRCYVCKSHLFEQIIAVAAAMDIRHVAHGANCDDLDDVRPGFRAAHELGIHAPLITAGLTKVDVRRLSKSMGLPTWDKPAMACLASRIPFGTPLTEAALRRIEALEDRLREAGIRSCRIRDHGAIARIEIPADAFATLLQPDVRRDIIAAVKGAGFDFVALDLEGYRSGSLNVTARRRESER